MHSSAVQSLVISCSILTAWQDLSKAANLQGFLLKGCIKWAGNAGKNCVLSYLPPFFFPLASFKLCPFLVTFIKFLLIHCLVLYAEDVLNTLIKRKPSAQLQCTVIESCNVHINFSQITFMKEDKAFSTSCKTPY